MEGVALRIHYSPYPVLGYLMLGAPDIQIEVRHGLPRDADVVGEFVESHRGRVDSPIFCRPNDPGQRLLPLAKRHGAMAHKGLQEGSVSISCSLRER